jgi:glutaredoxin
MTIPAPTADDVVIVWTKPDCGKCTAVKTKLKIAGIPYEERDLTAPENRRDLEHFVGLGYISAPITEYGPKAIPGMLVDELDELIATWRELHPGN